MEKFSYSKLSTYESCGFKYKLIYKDKHFINDPSIATDFGTLVHHIEEKIALTLIKKEPINYQELLNEFYNINTAFDEWKQEDGSSILGVNFLKTKYAKDFYEKDKNGLSYEDKVSRYTQIGIYRLEEYLKNNPTLTIVGVEQPFNLEYKKDIIFHGFVDRIFYDSSNSSYIIEDIKTYSAPLDRKDLTTPLQFVFYVLALKALHPEIDINSVRCAYDLPLCDTRQEAGTVGFVKRGEAKIEKLLENINKGKFEPHPTPLCHWCPFSATKPNQPEEAKNLCPYFSHWTRDNKDFSVEYDWMGEANHERILEHFKKKNQPESETEYRKIIRSLKSEIILEDKSKKEARRFTLRRD